MSEQTRAVIENIAAVLADADLTLADVIKSTVFLTDMSTFEQMNAVYRELFPKPYPTRSTIGVAALANPAYLVEIEVVALMPARTGQ